MAVPLPQHRRTLAVLARRRTGVLIPVLVCVDVRVLVVLIVALLGADRGHVHVPVAARRRHIRVAVVRVLRSVPVALHIAIAVRRVPSRRALQAATALRLVVIWLRIVDLAVARALTVV